MARLTPEQWEQARAEYEVPGRVSGRHRQTFRGITAGRIEARPERGLEARESCGVVDKKVNAIKALYEVEQESCGLPTTFSAPR